MKYWPLLAALATLPLISAANNQPQPDCKDGVCSDPNVKGYANTRPEAFNANSPQNLATSPEAGGNPVSNAHDAFMRAAIEGKPTEGRSDEEITEFTNSLNDAARGVPGDSTGGSKDSQGELKTNISVTSTSSSSNSSSSAKLQRLPENMCFAKALKKNATRGYKSANDGNTMYVIGNPKGKGWGYEYSKHNGNAYVGQYDKFTRHGKGYLFYTDKGKKRRVRFVDYDHGFPTTNMQKADISYWNGSNPDVYLRTLMEHMIAGQVLDTHRHK